MVPRGPSSWFSSAHEQTHPIQKRAFALTLRLALQLAVHPLALLHPLQPKLHTQAWSASSRYVYVHIYSSATKSMRILESKSEAWCRQIANWHSRKTNTRIVALRWWFVCKMRNFLIRFFLAARCKKVMQRIGQFTCDAIVSSCSSALGSWIWEVAIKS